MRRAVVPFVPRRPGHVGLYVCGMTVYDHAHVGHARAMVVFDAFVRYLRHRGWAVTYVRNVTDVDDKIIRRAAAAGEDPLARAQRFFDAFREDMRALGLLAPDLEPRVTASVPAIVALIERLIAAGHAYVVEGGDVWFAVSSAERYGALSRQRPDALDASADRASDGTGAGKRDARDFALWKAAREGEPSWEAPWGRGRPGWHIECSAMAHETLGGALDIHGGGLDLVFPHHENEIAQSEHAHGTEYAGHWMHNGLLVTSGGAKIARSEGNGRTIRDVLARLPAEALRFAYLRAHYRAPLAWDERAIEEALAQLARVYAALEVARAIADAGPDASGAEDADEAARALGEDAGTALALARAFGARVYDALDDDFDTPRVVVHALELARAMQRLAGDRRAARRAAPIAREVIAALETLRCIGLFGATPEELERELRAKVLPARGLDAAAVDAKLRARAEARARRAFDEADALRAELESAGVDVRDGPSGTEWRVRV